MKAGLAALMLGMLLALPSVASAGRSHRNSLPLGLTVLARRSLPGEGDATAIVYRSGSIHLGVIAGSGSHLRLLWSRPIPALPATIDTPGPSGLFRAVVKSHSAATLLFAYVFSSGRVRSAISSHPGGRLVAAEGIRLAPKGFTVRLPDTAHTGSVAYRWVDRYSWLGRTYARTSHTYEPDYASGSYPAPSGTVHNAAGDTILIRLRVADTEQQRETGLMNVRSLDPDSGMIFVWTTPVHESFWMENTYIPLTVAFLAADGTIQETQDMAPLSTNLHTPQKSYQFAIEVNLGFFADHGIRAGDRVELTLSHS